MRKAWMLTMSITALTLILLSGCVPESATHHERPSSKPTQIGAQFEVAQTGTIHGRVKWRGAIPKIEPFTSTPYPVRFPRGSGGPDQQWPNPNTPQIDPKTKGVANAVIFLRGVDLARSRPWDHAPVRIEQHDLHYQVHQGNNVSHIGFVQRGAEAEIVSTDRELYSLRARGAAFFTLIFPDPHSPLKRNLDRKGIVELRSGAGHFWMRAYLFTDDHPYYARTDEQGRFTLPRVPAGEYELVTWMPNWRVARRVQDWETSLTAIVDFAPPLVQEQSVTVKPRQSVRVELGVSAELFR